MKIKLSCLRLSFVCLQFLFSNLSVFSQVPLVGFEIEGILVDGCDGGNEGKNEMVTFTNGPVVLDINNIRVDGGGASGVIINGQWPSNNFLGWCTTPAATANIAILDAAITTSCGKLLEPPLGIIPAGGKVLIITSTDFTPVTTYFENLTDTLYVVLQCAGNTVGHFANYNATSSTRTLVLTNTVSGYADTIIYNRSLLLNSGGTPGSGDGGAVSYAWDGTPSYFNNGCQAPFIPISVSIDPVSNADCLTNIFTFSGNVMSGNYKGVIWESNGSGIFSAANSLTTNYTPGIGELGTVMISFKAIDYCDDTTTISQNITVSPIAVADAGNDVSICSSDSDFLGTTSTAGFDYSWSSTAGLNSSTISNPTVTLTNLTTGSITSTYTLVTTVLATGCTATDNVDVTVTPNEDASFTTTPSCTGGISSITGTAGGTFIFTSSPTDGASLNPSTGEITSGTSGATYGLTYTTSGTCSSTSNESITVINQDIASFTTTPSCTGGISTITGTLGGTFTFTISPTDGASLNASTGEVTGGTSGATYGLTYTTSGVCSDVSNVTLTTVSSLNALINISNDSSYCSFATIEDIFAIPAAGGTITWYSDPTLQLIVGTGNELIVNNTIGATEYYVTESFNGCESAPSIVTITISECEVVVPTAFTPNGDSVNDKWELANIDFLFPENVVKIYNRWGNLLFESSKGSYESKSWKGEFNGELLPIASYFFIIEYNKEGKETLTGTVSIIK